MSYKDAYITQIKLNNKKGSGTASSYITALNYLDEILRDSELFGLSGFWDITSVEMVSRLYEFALERQKIEGGEFLDGSYAPSYGRGGYYSAALKSFGQFLAIQQYEDRLWDIYDDDGLESKRVAERLAADEVEMPELLVDEKDMDFTDKEGKYVLRQAKARVGQDYFRKMILRQYGGACCVTGLTIPQVLRASHIVSWKDDEKNRLNPANGLCLSATYDAAFDRHLISFDEEYRMIFSPALNEYFSNVAFKAQFASFEGKSITRPKRFLPDQSFLEQHRNKMPT